MDNEKYLADMNPIEAMEFINDRFKKTKSNEEFLISMNSNLLKHLALTLN